MHLCKIKCVYKKAVKDTPQLSMGIASGKGSRLGEVKEDKGGQRRIFYFFLYLYIPGTTYNGS